MSSDLREFDWATREIARLTARLRSAVERRDQAAKRLHASGEWTYQQLADLSTRKGVPLSMRRIAQIVYGRPEREKR